MQRTRMFAFHGAVLGLMLAALQESPNPGATETPKNVTSADVYVIPTRYDADRFYITPVTADGHVIEFFSDTGGGLFLYDTAAERLGLEVMGPARISERFGDAIPPEAVRQVGGALVELPTFKPEASIPHPIGPWGEAFLLPVVAKRGGAARLVPLEHGDGMLGQRWFADRVWTFDYPKRRLLWRRDGALPPHGEDQRVTLAFPKNQAGQRVTNFPRMHITVDGNQIEVLLDTGATTTLAAGGLEAIGDGGPATRAASFMAAAVFDAWRARHPDWRYIEAAEGGSEAAMIEARDVIIAGQNIGTVWFTRRTDADYEWMSQWMDRPIQGAIGGNALRPFRVTVHYPDAVAVFERAGAP